MEAKKTVYKTVKGLNYPAMDNDEAWHSFQKDVFEIIGNSLETSSENPFAGFINPGNSVLVKPNLVRHENKNKKGGMEPLVTHPAVIRAVTEAVSIALKGNGKVVIGDTPLQSADFNLLEKYCRLHETAAICQQKYQVEVVVMDFRKERRVINQNGRVTLHEKLNGDPKGYVDFSLGTESAFHSVRKYAGLFRVSDYERAEEVTRYHTEKESNYRVSRSLIEADVLINLPKLKTHQKAGITLGMKNMIGVCACKEAIPHHRFGTPEEGGDEFPNISKEERARIRTYDRLRRYPVLLSICRYLYRISRLIRGKKMIAGESIEDGSWHGNDTIWRAIADLCRIARYGNIEGKVKDKSSRKIYTLIDGIIGGQGDGPLAPEPVPAGTIIAGEGFLGPDLTAARLIGVDPEKVPTYREVLANPDIIGLSEKLNIDGFKVFDISEKNYCSVKNIQPVIHFKLPANWDRITLNPSPKKQTNVTNVE